MLADPGHSCGDRVLTPRGARDWQFLGWVVMGLVRFALRLPHTFYVLAVLIVFLGVTAMMSMPTDIFPEINIPVVTVIWQYTGLSTPEMEQRVTTYGEYSLSSSVNGILDIEAQTLNGVSIQKIFFNPT